MYITHVRNTTSHLRRSLRAQVDDAELTTAQAWTRTAMLSSTPIPVPFSGSLLGTANIEHGGLVVSIYGPGGQLVIVIRVALRSRNGSLWPYPAETAFDGAHQKPREPWCSTTVLLPALAPTSVELHQLENALAWGWAEGRGSGTAA